MKKLLTFAAILVLSAVSFAASTPKAPKHHAAVRTAIAVGKVSGFFSKQTLHGAMFATENIIDGVHGGLFLADKAFEGLSIKGRIPVLDSIYKGVDVAENDTGKADKWMERQEMDLFGNSN